MAEVVERNFLDEQVLLDPFDTFEWARVHAPVLKMPGQDVFGVFSAGLVDEVLRRHDDFSNDFSDQLGGRYADDPEVKAIMATGYPHVAVMLATDPPLHTHQRKLINMAFAKPRVDAMAGQIRKIVIRLIEQFADRGECEFNEEFAIPLPVSVIAGQYGLGDVPEMTVKRWSDAISDRAGGVASREREIDCARLIVEFQHAMAERILARRERPEKYNDLLNDLVNARVEGESPLSDNELMEVLLQLVTAGNETISGAMGMGMLMLLRNPEKMALIRQDNAQIPKVVEEMLRYDSSASSTYRRATRQVELGGYTIPARALVIPRLTSANRDPELFPSPDDFEPGRRNGHRHYTFGKGIHACCGSMMARGQLTIAFQELANRLDNFVLAEEKVAYHPSILTRNVIALRIRFDRRKA